MPVFPNFVGPTYVSQSKVAGVERCINFYPERLESPGAKAEYALYPTPGVELAASSSFAPCRGSFSRDGRCFYVIGHKLVEVTEVAGVITLTDRGTVATDSNPAIILSNGDGGNQLLVVSGGLAYHYNLNTNTLTSTGLTAHHAGYLDGRFIILNTTISQIRISALLDGSTWPATLVRQRSAAADKWKAMVVANKAIYLFGSETYEVWYNSGAYPFPFEPIPGMVFTEGTAAPYSASVVGDTVAWLGGNREGEGRVMMAVQYAPQRLSNHAIENDMQTLRRAGTSLADAESMIYQEDGHIFYVLTAKAANRCWVVDLATGTLGQWHERLFWNPNAYGGPRWDAYRPLYHAYAFGYHLVGDRNNGDIYKMGLNKYRDIGSAYIRRERITPHVHAWGKRIRYSMLEIIMETGVGLSTGQGSDPQVMLQRSNDGGRTWGNEKWRSAGAIGEYRTRVRFNRLGSAYDRVFRVAVSDPIPWRIVGANLEGG